MTARHDVTVGETNDTSERILQAVIEGLQELDPSALTIQQVCRRAEVKAPTVYYYFGNKDGLIAAAVDSLVTRWIQQLDVLVDRTGSLDLAMTQAVGAWQLMITAQERPFAVFVWVSMWSPESRVALQRARAHAQGLIAEALTAHLATDEADDLAGVLLDGIVGAAVDYQLDNDTTALNRRLTALVRVVQAASNGALT
jgi:AcrR family transcriptional regulator